MPGLRIVTAIAALWLVPAYAEPRLGPEDDLYHYEGFEWLESGALFCLNEGACAEDELPFLFLIGEAGTSKLLVYAISTEWMDADDDCPRTALGFSGHLYGEPASLIYVARPPVTGGATGFEIIAVNLAPLAGPEPHLRFQSVPIADVFGGTYTERQSELTYALQRHGDYSVLEDPDWPDTWAAVRENGARILSELEESEVFTRLSLTRATTASERDAIQSRAIAVDYDGWPAETLGPETCLPEALFAAAGN